MCIVAGKRLYYLQVEPLISVSLLGKEEVDSVL